VGHGREKYAGLRESHQKAWRQRKKERIWHQHGTTAYTSAFWSRVIHAQEKNATFASFSEFSV